MSTALDSPEDVVNAALTQIGYKKRVAQMYDGSEAASLALNIYSQTVDQQLRLFEWGFAEKNAVLTLQKTAPVSGYVPPTYWTTDYPPIPWIYQYALPSDFVKVRALRQSYGIIPEYDPVAINFRMVHDAALIPNQQVIVTNLANAVMVYTSQVHNPALWEPLFTEGLIAALAKRLSAGLANIQEQQVQAQTEAVETRAAEARVG